MVFTREPISKPGRIAATVAQGIPEDGSRDAKTSRGGIGGVHGDAPNRDMTH